MNAPDRMDALRLPEGIAKCVLTPLVSRFCLCRRLRQSPPSLSQDRHRARRKGAQRGALCCVARGPHRGQPHAHVRSAAAEAAPLQPPPARAHPTPLLPRLLASRRELLRDPRVKFSGYKHPHPLDNDIIFRVQTGPGVVPSAAFISAANHLEQEFRALQGRLAEELRRVRDEAAPFE